MTAAGDPSRQLDDDPAGRWLRALTSATGRLHAPLQEGPAFPQLLERAREGLVRDFGAASVEVWPGPESTGLPPGAPEALRKRRAVRRASGGTWPVLIGGELRALLAGRWRESPPELLQQTVATFILHVQAVLERAQLQEQLAATRLNLQTSDTALEGRRRATERRRLVADASRELLTLIEYPLTLERVAELAVPLLADGCVVDLLEPGQTHPEVVAVAHEDPVQREALLALRRPTSAGAGDPWEVSRVIDSGQSVVHEGLELPGLGPVTVMVVPLGARSGAVGALSLIAGPGRTLCQAEDLATAEELGRRAAAAIDSARLYAQAQEAVRARDEFFCVASHELRTPIASLQVAVQSLLRVRSGGAEAPQRPDLLERVLRTVERQGKRLGRLVDNLFDVSSIMSGHIELRREPVDLAALAREAVSNLAHEGAAARAEVTVVEHGPAMGHWDRLRLERVVENLLSNALKYGEGRPVELTIGGQGDQAFLQVRDQGIGIPPESQEHIFSQFTRLAGAPATGLGLGLHIVRQVVTAMGGTIELISQPGEGSTFTVRLPLA